jgi:hypothetical protein
MKKAKKIKKQNDSVTLTSIPISKDQLRVIRKLNSYNTNGLNIPGYSKRTVESVLHGRRKNNAILHESIESARKVLERYNEIMNDIDKLLNDDIITVIEEDSPGTTDPELQQNIPSNE